MLKIDPEKKAEIDRKKFKANRTAAVAAIVVTVGQKQFDGDEQSQTRMARALVGMQDGETILWVLADNSDTQVTRAELVDALRLAGAAQTALWAMPKE